MAQEKTVTFAANETGKDYVVGDIHGMFSTLDDLLEQIAFDPKCDRLFSVGDLIDRGPESLRALEYLDFPWFHAVMGNHEQMLLRAQFDPMDLDNWTRFNGGEWWTDLDEPTRNIFCKKLPELPLAITIRTEQGDVGIVHADVPMRMSWPDFITALNDDEELQNFALWSRNRLTIGGETGAVPGIKGLNLMVVGHTPMREATRYNNIVYLDTAAAYAQDIVEAKLSVLQIHPQVHIHSISTSEVPSANTAIT